MIDRPRLDGAVPLDQGSSQDVALAALTRRVAEVEHRLDVMKVIVGLVLAGKALLVAFLLYAVFGGGLVVRGAGPARQVAGPARLPRPTAEAQLSPAVVHPRRSADGPSDPPVP